MKIAPEHDIQQLCTAADTEQWYAVPQCDLDHPFLERVSPGVTPCLSVVDAGIQRRIEIRASAYYDAFEWSR